MKTIQYKGYIIEHFLKQWQITIWENDDRPTVHIFPSLKTAKAWIDEVKAAALS